MDAIYPECLLLSPHMEQNYCVYTSLAEQVNTLLIAI